MTMVELIRQIAGDLMDRCCWTVDDYGGDAEAFARDLLAETDGWLRRLCDEDWGFLVFTLAEMAGRNTTFEERNK
jgi:hypothetical protein